MSWPDWGNVPSWVSTGSVMVAASIFARDRRKESRRHIDQLILDCSAWVAVEEREIPGGRVVYNPSTSILDFRCTMENAGRYPVYVHAVAYELAFTVIDDEDSEPGFLYSHKAIDYYPKRAVYQDSPLECGKPINFADTAVSSGGYISCIDPRPTVLSAEAYLSDYAGRRWCLRPLQLRSAQRIRPQNLRKSLWEESPSWKRFNPWDSRQPIGASSTRQLRKIENPSSPMHFL